MTDRDLAAQAAELLLVEHLRDETEVAQRSEPTVLRDRDPRRLLASMLKREKSEVREPRNVVVRRVDPEDAAHQATAPDLDEAALAEALDPARLAGEDRGAASRLVVVRELDVRLEPAAPGGGLCERGRDAAAADVVAEPQVRRRFPQEADQCRLGRERAVGRGREENGIAAPPAAGRLRTSSTSPTQPTTGVGGIETPSASL